MLHWLQKQNRLQPTIQVMIRLILFELQLTPETLVLHNAWQQQIRQQTETVLLTLTAKQKKWFGLRYYEGLNPLKTLHRTWNLFGKSLL